MDAPSQNKTRKFPAYTTQELYAALDDAILAPEKRAEIREEINRRESGESQILVVPQVGW